MLRGIRRAGSVLLAMAGTLTAVAASADSWTQWGGPNRDFKIEAGASLASSWPEEGPPRLWQRPLGGGHAQILAEGDALYVVFRRGDDDMAAALDAESGKTRWEKGFAAGDPYPGQVLEFGVGPNATPLLSGDRLYTVGFTGRMHCLDKASGETLWSHDLMGELDGKKLRFGYAAAPIAHGELVIALVGGEEHGAVGFDPATGEIRWKTEPIDVSYASPTLIELGGEDQLVFMTGTEIVGVGLPEAGLPGADVPGVDVKWRYPHKNRFRNNCAGPWWGDDGLMFVSSQADGGSRTLQLTSDGGRVAVEELSRSASLKIFHNSAVRLGGHVYGASGAFFTAHDVKTGEEAWKQRGFPEANVVYADGKAILLDENGTLTLATLSSEKLTVLARHELLVRPSWAAPTLVGSRLYVRDKEKILALELGDR